MCDICNKEHRALSTIASDIWAAWPKVNYAARPYLEAMSSLACPNEKFWMDDGKSIVLYFLCNASSFRGARAKELKAELKELTK